MGASAATTSGVSSTSETPKDAPGTASGEEQAGAGTAAIALRMQELTPDTPPLVDGDGRVRLSFSRIDTYRLCPLKFRYAYIDRLPRRPAPALSFGTSIHAALQRFYDRKIPTPPTVDELLVFLYDGWDSTGFADCDRDEQLAYYRHAQQVLRSFHDREAPRYRLPAGTETWFELPVDEVALVVGSIDRVDARPDGSLEVVDYKTNRRIRDRQRVRGSLQLAIYALACEHLYGQLPVAVTLDFVVAGTRVRVPTDEVDLQAARQAIVDTARAVSADGPYPPTPNRLCGWCDYRTVCPAWQGDGPEVLGPATRELERLRSRVRRDARALRELEAGVERARRALQDDPAAHTPDVDPPPGA